MLLKLSLACVYVVLYLAAAPHLSYALLPASPSCHPPNTCPICPASAHASGKFAASLCEFVCHKIAATQPDINVSQMLRTQPNEAPVLDAASSSCFRLLLPAPAPVTAPAPIASSASASAPAGCCLCALAVSGKATHVCNFLYE